MFMRNTYIELMGKIFSSGYLVLHTKPNTRFPLLIKRQLCSAICTLQPDLETIPAYSSNRNKPKIVSMLIIAGDEFYICRRYAALILIKIYFFYHIVGAMHLFESQAA
jgi:hypothetical protein